MMRGLFLAAFVLVLTTPVAAKEDHPGKSLRRALNTTLAVADPALLNTTTIDNTTTDVALDQPVDVVIVASPDADTVAVVVPVKDDTAPSGKAGGKSGGKGKKKKKDCKKKSLRRVERHRVRRVRARRVRARRARARRVRARRLKNATMMKRL
jgi:hypothetical protein